MKKIYGIIMAIGTVVSAQADSLYFTSGVITNGTNVTLNMGGLLSSSNRTCVVERYNPYYQSWQTLGNLTINSNGYGSYTTVLLDGVYGFYRAKATNSIPVTYSTNSFGAVSGELGEGYSMIGNPFGAKYLSEIFGENPMEGITVYKWINNLNNYVSSSYEFGRWSTNYQVGMCEGVLVYSLSNVVNRFTFSGLFNTNSSSFSLPQGYSIICTPLYKVVESGTWKVDTLNTNRLGGLSSLPVQTPGYSPQCTISRLADSLGNYQDYQLTNSVWWCQGVQTSVPLNVAEGFWINKPTNATWTVSRPIW